MTKQGRRDYNASTWSPAGEDRALAALARRFQRLERSPAHFNILTVRPPRRLSPVIGATTSAIAFQLNAFQGSAFQ